MVAKVQCGQYVSLRKLLNISRLQIASGTKDEHPPHSNSPFFFFFLFLKNAFTDWAWNPSFFLSLSFKRYIYRLGVKLFLFSLSFFHKTYFKQTASKILFLVLRRQIYKPRAKFSLFLFLIFQRHICKERKNLLQIQILSFFLFSEHIVINKQKPLAHSNSAATSRLLREDRMNSRLCRRSFVICLQIHKYKYINTNTYKKQRSNESSILG